MNNNFFMIQKRFLMKMQRLFILFFLVYCTSTQSMHIADDVINSSLTRRLTKTINTNLNVLGKTTLQKHLRTKQGAHILGKLIVGKLATFYNDVNIAGTLSVVDVIISGSVIGITGVAGATGATG